MESSKDNDEAKASSKDNDEAKASCLYRGREYSTEKIEEGLLPTNAERNLYVLNHILGYQDSPFISFSQKLAIATWYAFTEQLKFDKDRRPEVFVLDISAYQKDHPDKVYDLSESELIDRFRKECYTDPGFKWI